MRDYHHLLLCVFVLTQVIANVEAVSQCESGFFRCGNMTNSRCLPQKEWCDRESDCANGEDESFKNCHVRAGYWREWEDKVVSRSGAQQRSPVYQKLIDTNNFTCVLSGTPSFCICERYSVFCEGKNLTSIPDNLPNNTIGLNLGFNNIRQVGQWSLSSLSHLKVLNLRRNGLSHIPKYVFEALKSLDKLHLEHNEIGQLDAVLDDLNNLTFLDLNHNVLNHIPNEIGHLTNLRRLFLGDNKISQLKTSMFSGMDNLRSLMLSNNSIVNVPAGVFYNLTNLENLFLENNEIRVLKPGLLENLPKLEWLMLRENRIEDIENDFAINVPQLQFLDLSHNNIHVSCKQTLQVPSTVEWLQLTRNNLTCISNWTFAAVSHHLTVLHLNWNKIVTVHSDVFHRHKSLVEIDLSHNYIILLHQATFLFNCRLETLILGNNSFGSLPQTLFSKLIHLQRLDLKGAFIHNISSTMFRNLRALVQVVFENFQYCQYTPHVLNCSPKTDGVSTLKNLIDNVVVRSFIWTFAALTLLLNFLVILGRLTQSEGNRVVVLSIVNLAASDLLMGIYLSCIAAVDYIYRENFNRHAHRWVTSWHCMATGVIGVMSSEISLLTLFYMSMERCYTISQPLQHMKKSLSKNMQVFAAIWMSGFVLSILPLMFPHVTFFGEFYEENMLCFPLHLHVPRVDGWMYSALIFILINSIIILGIALCYIVILANIFKSEKASNRYINRRQDRQFMKRIVAIVVTDLLSWVPIIIIKCCALFNITIPESSYMWITAFALPINSVINPIIYSLSAHSFRRDILSRSNSQQAAEVNLSAFVPRNIEFKADSSEGICLNTSE